MNEQQPNKQIEELESKNFVFSDFTKFEDKQSRRKNERELFIRGEKYVPDYSYPGLEFLQDKKSMSSKKSKITKAVLELEQLKLQPNVNAAELELFASTYENRLKKIELVEAASILNGLGPVESDYETSSRSYMELNQEVYGPFDNELFLGMLASEKNNLPDYPLISIIDSEIVKGLKQYFESIEIGNYEERELLTIDQMNLIHQCIDRRYASILSVVPDTGNDIYYDAEQCRDIMQSALEIGGLAERGWVVIVDSSELNPATTATKKRIALPSSTRRNSSELKRLIIHEQEVHARRGDNGDKSGIKILKNGTGNYSESEEGLGVLLECALEGNFTNASFDRARYRYIAAGLALGADSAPRDARQVFEILWRMMAVHSNPEGGISENDELDSKEKAYAIVENAFRSTNFSSRGIIYTKLKLYYEGLRKNAEFLKQHIESLDDAFDQIMIGKYDHTDPHESELIKAAVNQVSQDNYK